jgi:hypothetical protein
MFLVNSRYRHFSATPLGSRSKSFHLPGAHLLPKLRCHFAEFLNQGYLKRLGILSPPTCVGLRYDHLDISLEAFLGSMGSIGLWVKDPPHHLSALGKRICLSSQPTGLNHLFQQAADLPSCVPPSLKRYPGGTGILTCFPLPTPFGLGLGID